MVTNNNSIKIGGSVINSSINIGSNKVEQQIANPDYEKIIAIVDKCLNTLAIETNKTEFGNEANSVIADLQKAKESAVHRKDRATIKNILCGIQKRLSNIGDSLIANGIFTLIGNVIQDL